MAKKMKRFLVLALALILCIVSIAVPALADDGTVVETSSEGLTVTTTTTTNDNGSGVVTVTIEKATEGTTTDGVKVEGSETTVTETTTTTTEEAITETTTTDTVGEEKREWTEEVQPGEEVPAVEVELIPGKKTEGSVTDTTTEVEGTVGSGDEEYDYTKTTTTIDREVTAETGEIEITVEKEKADLECSVKPEDYEGKKYNTHETITGFTQPDGLQPNQNPDYKTPGEKPEEEGYDYVLSGSGDATWAAAPVFKNIVYKRDENGNALVDENGNFIIDEEKSGLVYAGSKAGYSGMNGTPGQIVVKNEDGELFYTYCIDKENLTTDGTWYKITNLEDSDYYPDKESADKLRAIVENGYWGTKEGTGSLAEIKKLLAATYDKDATVTVKDAKGNDVTYNIYDIIETLDEHEALACTQAAIWSYSNGALDTLNGKDGIAVVGVQSAKKFFNGTALDRPLNQYAPVYNTESDAVMKALYECLMGLEPVSADSEDVTTIINEKNAVKDMALTVYDKAEGYEANEDEDDTNDVYNAGMNFTLSFVPDPKSDDLLVYLTDEEGNFINGADGKPIVKRLAGENTEGREHDTILPDANGVYTLTGLQLSENEDFKFDLRLEGTQYLKEGVYVYTAHGGRTASQTLVGMAKGNRNVEVAVGMTVSFNVDESKNVVAERKWHSKNTQTVVTPLTPEVPGDPGDPGDPDDPNVVVIDNTPVPLAATMMLVGEDELVILDEEVPLADAPQTGDNSIVYVLISLISLCGIVLLSKKRCVA